MNLQPSNPNESLTHVAALPCSKGGLIFGIINIIGNFGTVFCDQAYWVRYSPSPFFPHPPVHVTHLLAPVALRFPVLMLMPLLCSNPPLPPAPVPPTVATFWEVSCGESLDLKSPSLSLYTSPKSHILPSHHNYDCKIRSSQVMPGHEGFWFR